jgi:hypothetical protein
MEFKLIKEAEGQISNKKVEYDFLGQEGREVIIVFPSADSSTSNKYFAMVRLYASVKNTKSFPKSVMLKIEDITLSARGNNIHASADSAESVMSINIEDIDFVDSGKVPVVHMKA